MAVSSGVTESAAIARDGGREGHVEPRDHINIVFTDLDGTCVHYPGQRVYQCQHHGVDEEVNAGSVRVSLDVEPSADGGDHDKARLGLFSARVSFKIEGNSETTDVDALYDLVALPESSSGSRGFISLATLEHYKQIRAKGVVLVVISGCRYSTLLERLPFIPQADVYACESGGRIFYNEQGTLYEDLRWKAGMRDQLEEMRRCKEAFKEAFREELDMGLMKLDDRSYTTAFRVRRGKFAGHRVDGMPGVVASHVERVQAWMSSRTGLSSTTNLGCVDIYPERSGKMRAAAYIAERLGGWKLGKHAAFFCDDDNDIELALNANRVFLPGMSEGLGDVVVREMMGNESAVGRLPTKYRFIHSFAHDGRLVWFGNEPFSHTEYLLGALCRELDAQEEGNALVYCRTCGRVASDCHHEEP